MLWNTLKAPTIRYLHFTKATGKWPSILQVLYDSRHNVNPQTSCSRIEYFAGILVKEGKS